jgi:hypothetical protein
VAITSSSSSSSESAAAGGFDCGILNTNSCSLDALESLDFRLFSNFRLLFVDFDLDCGLSDFFGTNEEASTTSTVTDETAEEASCLDFFFFCFSFASSFLLDFDAVAEVGVVDVVVEGELLTLPLDVDFFGAFGLEGVSVVDLVVVEVGGVDFVVEGEVLTVVALFVDLFGDFGLDGVSVVDGEGAALFWRSLN